MPCEEANFKLRVAAACTLTAPPGLECVNKQPRVRVLLTSKSLNRN